ncbi:Ldh family oxidoreductase [Paracandidimonas soli]|uniref:Ldh family oxidoreductase n=1 Tax=Paracandidimonas soli TaxID=1917182 RepID=UPI00334116E9
MSESVGRYEYDALLDYAQRLFRAAGMEEDKARSVAWVLVEADLIGHATHGLALVPVYLDALRKGIMSPSGEPEVISDRGASMAWRGNMLPGGWLVLKALDLCVSRAANYGTATCVIDNSQHIGALAVYMKRVTDLGMMAIISSSTSSSRGVAPYGGTKPLFTPNPLAAGIPTSGDPIVLDISASITTINYARQLHKRGERFPQPWALSAGGEPSDDPDVLVNQGGSLLPVGGMDHGHKGYSMALLVEAMTQGLGGRGRADATTGTYTSVFIQVLDPAAFGGREGYVRQMDWLADACRSNPPVPGGKPVRVPGDRAAVNREEALRNGVPLRQSIVEPLLAASQQLGVEMPAAIAAG